MRSTGICHNKRGRLILKWEDALVRHMGIDWQDQARRADWRSHFDFFRNAVYQSHEMKVPESRRPNQAKSKPNLRAVKRVRVAPPTVNYWQEPEQAADSATSVPRCLILGDSKLVCQWLNGEWSVKNLDYLGLLSLAWQSCYQWIEKSVCHPSAPWTNFCEHIYREYNREADRAANRHVWHFWKRSSFAIMLGGAKLFKAYFDGSYHEDGSSCAGIVIFCSKAGHDDFALMCELSVPLSVDSACQAELAAMTLTIVLLSCLLCRTSCRDIEQEMKCFIRNSIDVLSRNAIGVLMFRGE